MVVNRNLHCPHCKTEIRPLEILEKSTISWPELNWIYFHCENCGKNTHIKVVDKKMSTIEFIGAPGPDWEIIESITVDEIWTRNDPAGIYVWFREKMFLFDAKK